MTETLLLGAPWISVTLWDTGIYYKDDDNWYLFQHKDKQKPSWTFYCFEFNTSAGTGRLWEDGVLHPTEFEIETLRNETRKPQTMETHLIMGKLPLDVSQGYYCREVVVKFGNLNIYDNFPVSNVSCKSEGNYLGK